MRARDAFAGAWEAMLAALPADDEAAVRASRLMGKAGLARRANPFITRALPEWTISQLRSERSELSDRQLEVITQRLCETAPRFAYGARLLTEVWRELKSVDYGAGDDRIYRAVADATFANDSPVGEEPNHLAVAHVVEGLLRAATLSAASLAEFFADGGAVEVIVIETLDDAWSNRPAAHDDERMREQQRRALDRFLQQVGMVGGRPTVSPEGVEAWEALVALDPPLVVLANLPSLGLSSGPAPARPDATGLDVARVAENPPLDRSVHARLWSAVKGVKDEWRHELPAIVEMVELEARATAQPLGLRTPHARAGLAVAVYATFAVRQELDTAGDARLPAGIAYFRRVINGFVKSVGGDRRLTEGAKRTLDDAGREMLPELWGALHGLEYRHEDLVRDPREIWARVAGELHSLSKNIRERWKKLQAGKMPDDARVDTNADGVSSHADPDTELSPGETSRDDRVDATRTHIMARPDGEDCLRSIVAPLLGVSSTIEDIARARAAWLAAAQEIRDGASPYPFGPEDAASWGDLEEYIADHSIPLTDRSDENDDDA